ncbi:hypothetical protein H1R82_08550 [Thermoactinomyces intermedius]|jgi:hypothetical protein|uniref:Uncharacterized protein n=1 Tax=Thermoactinomyces intermedius TaxID=2024 RepID=A0A8I1DEA8_THEIN|nr:MULTISPECIES: hypothetical protein [Thermoactinomyces]MBA4548602.1 hypothetical protein [Thermoactinomyces intermedius]MBA4836676.1 hypothetical protein [Thermoactinomyces intermedius]MBH8594480.1 hypothetical protein [Thermoactinomyces intermedius]MBH8601616.1 hypothetical protein [Thermoactinomyces sp. CICC 23799]
MEKEKTRASGIMRDGWFQGAGKGDGQCSDESGEGGLFYKSFLPSKKTMRKKVKNYMLFVL